MIHNFNSKHVIYVFLTAFKYLMSIINFTNATSSKTDEKHQLINGCHGMLEYNIKIEILNFRFSAI
jgi:hypothetical protein